ncbi:Flagellar biosynthesis protein FlhB [hydrothermal vent metagenome]|uniref:Flagellar biosynthetic protein FlhB n=1 Tax=hydrothermal vent metagenome TaxID=652676 RepID=A0A3B1C1V8_9ZZZZ
MAEEEKESKTEEPTEKKLGDTRKKGRTAKSQEVNTVILLIAAVIYFLYMGFYMIDGVNLVMREYFVSAGAYDLTPSSTQFLIQITFKQLFLLTMPFMFTMALAGVFANYWQNDGWIFSWDPLTPKFNKLNPLTGWKKFLGKEGAMNLGKSLIKLALISTAVYMAADDEWELIPVLMNSTIIQIFQILGAQILDLVLKVLFVLIILAIIDFAWQKYQFIQNLKMTKQEVKDERKQQEGDPIIKQRIRQKQFEMFRNRMMASVPEAEVIITNPTHLSIALRYNRVSDPAPVLVAKGAGYIALKIREIAKENGITIVEDKELARTLFKNVDIGDVIPESLYKAVAETLAYVYKLKNKAL